MAEGLVPGGIAFRRGLDPAHEGRRLPAEVIPLLYANRQTISELEGNSSWQFLAGAGERDSRSCCPETRERRRAPRGPGSFPRQRAGSTYPGRRLSSVRDHIRDEGRYRVVSSIPSSYCLRSSLVASRALMMRIRSPRAVCATNRIRCSAERPIVISRSSSSE